MALRSAVRCAVGAAFTILIAACAPMSSLSGGAGAVAMMKPTAGNTAAGTVRFEPVGGKVVVTAEISGLKANSEHGFHVHEKGDCSVPDATSAGGHFNPGGKPHAHYGQAERHGGDMPNLKADAAGNAKYRWESDLLTVGSGPANVIGRGVVIHRDPDDYSSQPAGNSGPRLSCGVITAK